MTLNCIYLCKASVNMKKVSCEALSISCTRLIFCLINFIWMIKIARHKLMFIAAANDRLFIIPQISVFVHTSSCCRSERCWLLLDLALCNWLCLPSLRWLLLPRCGKTQGRREGMMTRTTTGTRKESLVANWIMISTDRVIDLEKRKSRKKQGRLSFREKIEFFFKATIWIPTLGEKWCTATIDSNQNMTF